MEKYPDYLETMARAAEPAVLAKKAQLFAEATAEWTKDREGYTFECRRFGDFLVVFIERSANPDPKKQQYTSFPRKFTTAVNIGTTREIRLIKGHDPDLNGEFNYSADRAAEAKDGVELQYESSDKKTVTGFFKVQPSDRFPRLPSYGREVFKLDPAPQNNGVLMGYSSNGIRSTKYRTENYVRVATDDQIRFEGIGATLFVPSGLGQQVYDSILRELAKP